MDLAESAGHVLGNYATFSGRARRSEFWWWYLVLVVIGVVSSFFDRILGSGIIGGSVDLVFGLIGLALLLPSLAVTVRRLHDTGRSGWWLLIGLVPVVGQLILLFFCLLPSDRGPNQHGFAPA